MPREHRHSRSTLLLFASLALALAPAGLYGCGYLWSAEVKRSYWTRVPIVHRIYPSEWLARMFAPAGRLEEYLMNYEVEIGSRDHLANP